MSDALRGAELGPGGSMSDVQGPELGPEVCTVRANT